MKFQKVTYPEKLLVGLATPTAFTDTENTEIKTLVQTYFSQEIAKKIPFRKSPGVTYAAYTEYTSDEYGEYLYFIGEAVEKIEQLPPGLNSLSIRSGEYLKYTTPAGKMPDVVIQAWKNIWKLTKENSLDGTRNYRTDFEVYDRRAQDPTNTVVDLFVGIV